MRKVGLVSLLVAATLGAGVAESSHGPDSDGPTLPGCTSRASGSRWLNTSEGFQVRGMYGKEEGHWLATVAGVAYEGGRLFVFDEGRPAILELSKDLSLVREFGRRGAGPGEITDGIFRPFLLPFDYNFLGFDGQSVVIYDRREVEVFTPNGEHKYQIALPDDSHPWSFGVRYVRPYGNDRLVYVNDSIDWTDRLPRRFQVWQIDGVSRREPPELLWEIPVPWGGALAGRQRAARTARPLWAAHGECQIATDGTGKFLFKYDRVTGVLDSVPLPTWEVPAFGEDPDDKSISLPGVVNLSGEPAALVRWTDLMVDPDGYAWVKAWTTRKGGEVVIFGVSLETGSVTRVVAPAFPRAFGEPGRFYTVEHDSATNAPIIVLYGK